MKKQAVIKLIRSHLEEELTELRSSDSISREPDARIQELERALLMYRFLPIREFSSEDVIAPASLTELDFSGRRIWVLLVPQYGGLITRHEGHPVQVVTPSSPLGEAMLGKKIGDLVTVSTDSGMREYRIIQIL